MKRNIIFWSIIGLLVIAISSCSLSGTSIMDRIGFFEDDLNGSRSNIIDHFHPDAANYNNLDATYFDTGFLKTSWGDHTITGINVTGSTATGTLTYNDNGAQTAPIVLVMRDDGDSKGENWKIYSITVDGVTQFN